MCMGGYRRVRLHVFVCVCGCVCGGMSVRMCGWLSVCLCGQLPVCLFMGVSIRAVCLSECVCVRTSGSP